MLITLTHPPPTHTCTLSSMHTHPVPRAPQLAPTMGALATDALGEGYAHNAWHLHLFGVLPAFHGKGYGRMLVEHVDRLVRLLLCTHTTLYNLG